MKENHLTRRVAKTRQGNKKEKRSKAGAEQMRRKAKGRSGDEEKKNG